MKRPASLAAGVTATLCLLPFVLSAAQQRDTAPAPARGTATLSGTVITTAASSLPVRRALVSLTSTDAVPGDRQVLTDDNGAFAFSELPAGRYMLTATKPGMVPAAYGAKRPGRPGSAIQIADGQQRGDVRLPMLSGAVLAGTVRDPAGRPVPDARVHVLRYGYGYQTGERELQSASPGLGESTDDRGQYRVFGLPPGEYAVAVTVGPIGSGGTAAHQTSAADVQWATRQMSASGRSNAPPAPPAAGPDVDYVPVFHPGTWNQTGAALVKLDAGQERTGIDVTLQLLPMAKLECTVDSISGPPPPNLQVTLISHDRIPGIPFSGFSSSPALRDGKYTFTGLTPGEYSVMVRVRPAAAPGQRVPATPSAAGSDSDLFAIERVRIAGTDTSVRLMLRPGVTVAGRLAFDGTATPPADLTKARISLAPDLTGGGAVLAVPSATVDKDGSFSFRGVTPGRYRISASMPAGLKDPWQPRRADLNGRDVLDVAFDVRSDDVTGLVVTFTDRPAELSGTIQDPQGHPATEFSIIVFARDRTLWSPQSRRIRAVRAGSDGQFVFANLPPGEYGLAAVTDVEPNEWFDPAFLTQLEPASIAITIADGEKKVQDIRARSDPSHTLSGSL
jgi:protocatechuate 3,4-dioxygenase beta subunit